MKVLLPFMLVVVCLGLFGVIVKVGLSQKPPAATTTTTSKPDKAAAKSKGAAKGKAKVEKTAKADPQRFQLPPNTPGNDPTAFAKGDWQRSASIATFASSTSTVDRVSKEIVDALDSRPTLAIWLFDRTDSASSVRDMVSRRLDDIYKSFADMKKNGVEGFQKDQALLSVVGSFGTNLTWLTDEPTDDGDKIHDAASRITGETESPVNTFAAISQAVEKYLPYRTQRGRMVLVIVVTDKAGDDPDKQDELSQVTSKKAIPVYVLGPSAPFGRAEAPSSNMARKDQKPPKTGPESIEPELVKLQDGNGRDDMEVMDSGFGPYDLARLCHESGGAYLALSGSSGGGGGGFGRSMDMRRFDGKAMSKYAPDYISHAQYEALKSSNKALQSLVEASKLAPVQVSADYTLSFTKTTEAKMKTDLDKAQRSSARIEQPLREVYEILARGQGDRAQITIPRWQAAYDVAMGRVLAARSRAEGYNAMLAQMKAGRNFPDPKHNTWILKATDDVKGDSNLEKLAKQARTYLDRVVKDHPGTPWATMAERELHSPLGWEWSSQ